MRLLPGSKSIRSFRSAPQIAAEVIWVGRVCSVRMIACGLKTERHAASSAARICRSVSETASLTCLGRHVEGGGQSVDETSGMVQVASQQSSRQVNEAVS